MYTPVATYRVQLHKEFNLQALNNIIAYLQKLGISTVYAAPVLQSIAGSTHGYDAIDPHQVNPEIGSLDELVALCGRLRTMNIGWMQDIVPNHMAYHTSNKILMDVLERGNQSPFYHYFDINWSHPAADLDGKLMLPVLSNELTEIIKDGHLEIAVTDSGMAIAYYDQYYPLSVPAVMFLQQQPVFKKFKEADPSNPLTYALQAAHLLPLNEWQAHKEAAFSAHSTDALHSLHDAVNEVNVNHDLLLQALDKNFYRFVLPQRVPTEINYRRFFTVNELICTSMERPEVFDHYHQLIGRLVKQNCFQALRVDHIDGLKDPLTYLKKLRALAGEDCYILTEKILSGDEAVPPDWPQQGTTGYDFLRIMNRVFIKSEHLQKLKALYFRLFPDQSSYEQQVAECKQLILEKYMKGELTNLTGQLLSLPGMEASNRQEMQAALGFLMVAMPCYRAYPKQFPLTGEDAAVLKTAFKRARELAPQTGALNELETLLLPPTDNPAHDDAVLDFLQRMMQFTGPLTAKGVEDTVFYRYCVLLSHNEVGDHPSDEAFTAVQFHTLMEERLQRNPIALNATTTHDTKRGEDARIRINCLGLVFDHWKNCVDAWLRDNIQYKTMVNGLQAPTVADEYFIYQSMVGGAEPGEQLTEEWQKRFCDFMIKALREAKVNSLWEQPNSTYEEACMSFIRSICKHLPFTTAFTALVKEVDRFAHTFSLGQAVLKMTAPGVPDIYQGCERWDYSFVDPDNRRAVNYTAIHQSLEDMLSAEQQGTGNIISFSQQHWREGLPKLFVTHKTLQLRQAYKNVFSAGAYIPLTVINAEAEVIAYARQFEQHWIIVIVPLQLPGQFSANAMVQLPAGSPSAWRNIFTGKEMKEVQRISIHEVLSGFPVAVLEAL